MKKIMILAGICLAMCTSVMAQDFEGGQRGGQGGQRARRQMDMVVDTAVINHIDLKAETLQKVYELQQAKQAEQKEIMQSARPQKGQRMSDEDRKAFQEKRQAFTAQYRKELRALIGDEAYILYLERMVDRQGMMRMGGQRPQGQGGQRGGQGGQRGGFGEEGNF